MKIKFKEIQKLSNEQKIIYKSQKNVVRGREPETSILFATDSDLD